MNHLYRVRPSSKAKRLALRLDPVERIFNLVVPLRCSMKQAYDFADQYEGWMQDRISSLPAEISFSHGSIIPLNGIDYKIDIHSDISLKKTFIELKKKDIYVLTNKVDPSVRIVRWIKAYSQNVLEVKSKEKSLTINKEIKKVTVRETKSRWGSCTCDGNLSYSWRLIFAPPEALDYVIAHEVAHLVHLDHSKQFWALCRELSKNYIAGKRWMKHHGHELMRYGSVPTYQEPLEE